MRVLLAIINDVEPAPAVLAATGLVAARLSRVCIDVLHVRRARDVSFMPTEEVMTPDRRAHFAALEAARSAALRTVFEAWRHRAGLADVGWREKCGEPAAIVAREGRNADLIVLGRTAHPAPDERSATIEAALFAAGAPVLLVPRSVPDSLGVHIAVAWTPGEAAERAIVAATPLLRTAARVTVLVGGEIAADATSPYLLVPALAGCGVVAVPYAFALAGERIGPALLREARRVGADLLVMGAYAHRRGMEALFGGATRDILAGADLPVLLHH